MSNAHPLKTYYIETWGCQMNVYDSQKMGHLIERSHQMQLVQNPEEADLLLLNTCSIREKAEEKVFSLLGRWRQLKDMFPHKKIGVGGCVASQEGERIFNRAPYVDFVFGPQTLQYLPLYINELLAGNRHFVHIDFLPNEKFDELPPARAEGPTAFVTIQEGCSKYCKYCIVPFTRGPEVNRNVEDILKEIQDLAAQRVREITLLGQNVNAYSKHDEKGQLFDLATLIFYVAQIPGIERIRFTTSHPIEFNDTLVRAYAQVPELCSQLHLPVQSGSNHILQEMGRGHSREQYLETIMALKNARSDLTISSDFIVGYPGETEEDFEQTLDLVRKVGFISSYSFIYSPRPGTLASGMECTLSEIQKKDRLKRLQDLLNVQTRHYYQSCLNKVFTVLITQKSSYGDHYEGRTAQNVVVHIPHLDDRYIGVMVDVQVVEVLAHSLRARLLRINDPYLKEIASFGMVHDAIQSSQDLFQWFDIEKHEL